MTDRLEDVAITANGEPFPWWTVISVTYGAEQASRTASLTVVDPGVAVRGSDWPLMPDVPVEITASGDLLLTGYGRDFDPSHEEENWSGTVGIVSRSIDAVEASVVHPTGNANDLDLLQIAQTFDDVGVGWISDESLPVEPWHQLIPGESDWDSVERRARSSGVLIYDEPDGRLRLATKPPGRHAGGLKNGVNIVRASGHLTSDGRFSQVKARGQATRGSGAGVLRVEAEAQDSGVPRYRPRVLIHEGETTSERLKRRVDWEVRRAAGRSRSATVTTAGWRDEAGTLWTSHWLVHLDDPRIFLNQDMAISSVTLTQDTNDGSEGTSAILGLVDPRALGGEDPKGDSADAWAGEAPRPTIRTE